MMFTGLKLAGFPVALLAMTLTAGFGQSPTTDNADRLRSVYALGPDDQITLLALDADEISNKPFRINPSGYVTLPMLGPVQAAGLTVEQLEAELTKRLKTYVQDAHVSVTITEFRSQPVSVIGAVKLPGVVQLQGRKTLLEMLSLAGGMREDAGYSVKITRSAEWGQIPLPDAQKDPTGKFTVGEVPLKEILDARHPEKNILIRPNDVISVPRADIVYVIGEVPKGFDQRSDDGPMFPAAIGAGEQRVLPVQRNLGGSRPWRWCSSAVAKPLASAPP